MSLMDKIKEMFSGGSADRKDEHDHSGHDHAGHDHAAHEHEPVATPAPMPPADPTGMAEPTEPERRDDL